MTTDGFLYLLINPHNGSGPYELRVTRDESGQFALIARGLRLRSFPTFEEANAAATAIRLSEEGNGS